jgi:hypothetical protein
VRFTPVVAASLHITAGVALVDLCGAPHKSTRWATCRVNGAARISFSSWSPAGTNAEVKAIAREVGVAVNTVRRYLRQLITPGQQIRPAARRLTDDRREEARTRVAPASCAATVMSLYLTAARPTFNADVPACPRPAPPANHRTRALR